MSPIAWKTGHDSHSGPRIAHPRPSPSLSMRNSPFRVPTSSITRIRPPRSSILVDNDCRGRANSSLAEPLRHEVVRVLDHVLYQTVGDRGVARDGVPVAFVEVVARQDIGIRAAQGSGQ